jgi:hypothetical protein
LGAAGGGQNQSLAANQIPSLTSSNASQSITVTGPNGHTVPFDAVITGQAYATAGANAPPWSGGGSSSSLSFSGNNLISVTYTNSSQVAVKTTPPTIICNYIIRVL